MKFCVVIPCYNERDNIPLIVRRVRETFVGRDNIDIILVDNGSTDGSEAVFAAQLAGQSMMRCVRVDQNKGYGHGIMMGFGTATDAQVYGWTHADMQADPLDLLTAFDLLCAKDITTHIVKGKRENRALLDTMFTFGMQVFASLALGVSVNDVNAQPKVFGRAFFDSHVRGKAPLDFSLDLFLLYQARKAGMTILTVPVVFADRLHGEAKGGGNWRTRIKLVKRTFAYILNLRRSNKTGLGQ